MLDEQIERGDGFLHTCSLDVMLRYKERSREIEDERSTAKESWRDRKRKKERRGFNRYFPNDDKLITTRYCFTT